MKLLDWLVRTKLFKSSLRSKVLFVFVLPMILILVEFSIIHNTREQKEVEEQIQKATIQMGDMALSGMRNAMLRNDQEVVGRIIHNYSTNPSITKMQIIDMDFRIVQSTDSGEIGRILDTSSRECIPCHQYPAQDRPRVIPLTIDDSVLRVITPIANNTECQACHPAENKHLGVLMTDAPLEPMLESVRDEQLYNIGISSLTILLVTLLAYAMIQWLVIDRVGILYKYLNGYAGGDFSTRIPNTWRTEDEITKLANHFNAIADSLEQEQKKQRDIATARQEAVLEERDRIARELHDGVAQFIAYINTKTAAVRLNLKNGRIEEADGQLAQIEQAVNEQALDVRASIIGLKMAAEGGSGFITGLRQLVDQCRRLSDYGIQLELDSGAEKLHLEPETELHLLRILQEALSNIRKHAAARNVLLSVRLQGDDLELLIKDDGIGFNPWHWVGNDHAHFGLNNMRDRVDAIGGKLSIESEPGHGTRVRVNLKIQEL